MDGILGGWPLSVCIYEVLLATSPKQWRNQSAWQSRDIADVRFVHGVAKAGLATAVLKAVCMDDEHSPDADGSAHE